MIVLLQPVTWWSIAPVSRPFTAGSLFILRTPPSRLARRSRRQTGAIHFPVCLCRRLKLFNSAVTSQLMSGQIFISYRREDASSCHDGLRFAFWKELPQVIHKDLPTNACDCGHF